MKRARDEQSELRQRIDAPIYNRVIKKYVGSGELDYEVYLRTPQLLSLQTGPAELVSPDELMFQIVHQTQELWLKLIAHEEVSLVDDLDDDDVPAATARVARLVRTARVLGEEIKVLHTLTPGNYQVIRRSLGSGSGQESPGYNRLLEAAHAVEIAFDELLARRGITIVEVYMDSGAPPGVQGLCELLVDFDEAFQQWLFSHLTLVRRTIGIDRGVKALDGIPTTVLAARATQPLFPKLWDARIEMTLAWQREGGFAPGAARRTPQTRTSSGVRPRVKEPKE